MQSYQYEHSDTVNFYTRLRTTEWAAARAQKPVWLLWITEKSFAPTLKLMIH